MSRPFVREIEGGLETAGLVVAHTHLYSALARGMPGPAVAPTNFVEILERVWWKLDRALDRESIAMSARVGIAEAARAGATCLIDHHESPRAIEGSLDAIADEFQAAGMRGVVAYGITARNDGEREWRAGLAETERFLRTNTRPLVRGMVGVHACFTVPHEALIAAARLARDFGVGLHIHVAEDAVDRDAVHKLIAAGALVPGSIYAHGVHLQDDEVKRLADSGGWLVQNARSNMGNRVGYARLDAAGRRVALGTDGWDGDMLTEARVLMVRAMEEGDPVDLLARLDTGAEIARAIFGDTLDGDTTRFDYAAPTPTAHLGAHLFSTAVRVRQALVDSHTPAPHLVASAAKATAAALWDRMADIS